MAAEITTYVAKKIADVLFAKFTNVFATRRGSHAISLQDRIDTHLKMVNNWSAVCTTVGLGVPKDVDNTVSLGLHTTPRRYRGLGSTETAISEADMMSDDSSYAVIGDPGSGKTTTLKRLARQLLRGEPDSGMCFPQYPILVELRSLGLEETLLPRLADIFGLTIKKEWVATTKKEGQLELGRHNDLGIPSKPRAHYQSASRRRRSSREEEIGAWESRIAGRPAEETLADILSQTGAVLMVDGLDEIAYKTKLAVEREIRGLAKYIIDSKIIVTCRSGDYRTNFDTFSTAEILPLDSQQIREIASFWMDDPQPFLDCLAGMPYADVVDRPLVLTFLLYLFNATGELPKQPSMIYRQVVYRLLKEWDENRDITRKSRYGGFDPDRKAEFLAELSYYLTYKVKGKVFNEQSFAQAYEQICGSYDLPLEEMDIVASEIETHTGLLYASGIGTFEFSHLSIQEYLCAHYLVRTPHPDLMVDYLEEYPAPLAIACSLSSDPSRYFAELVKRYLIKQFREDRDADPRSPDQLLLHLFNTETLPIFLRRLKLESPSFRQHEDFGLTVLCLLAFYYETCSSEVDSLLKDFLEFPNVLESIALGLQALGKRAYKLKKDYVGFDIDEWFASLYVDVNPPWHVSAKELAFYPERVRNFTIGQIENRLTRKARRKGKGDDSDPYVPNFPVVLLPGKYAKRISALMAAGLIIEQLRGPSDLASRLQSRLNSMAVKRG